MRDLKFLLQFTYDPSDILFKVPGIEKIISTDTNSDLGNSGTEECLSFSIQI